MKIKKVAVCWIMAVAITSIIMVSAYTFCVVRKKNSRQVIDSNAELFVSHASQLALIYRLRRACSITNNQDIFHHMDRIQDRLIINLKEHAETLSSDEDKVKIRLVLAAIADATTYGYGKSKYDNSQEMDLHKKALNVLAKAKQEHQTYKEKLEGKKLKNVTTLGNIKEKGFFTGQTNEVVE